MYIKPICKDKNGYNIFADPKEQNCVFTEGHTYYYNDVLGFKDGGYRFYEDCIDMCNGNIHTVRIPGLYFLEVLPNMEKCVKDYHGYRTKELTVRKRLTTKDLIEVDKEGYVLGSILVDMYNYSSMSDGSFGLIIDKIAEVDTKGHILYEILSLNLKEHFKRKIEDYILKLGRCDYIIKAAAKTKSMEMLRKYEEFIIEDNDLEYMCRFGSEVKNANKILLIEKVFDKIPLDVFFGDDFVEFFCESNIKRSIEEYWQREEN
jgi:hypothetical protein